MRSLRFSPTLHINATHDFPVIPAREIARLTVIMHSSHPQAAAGWQSACGLGFN